MKIFSINCINSRIENLKLILPNILEQADKLYINFIGVDKLPEIPYIKNNKKIIINQFFKGGSELRFFNYDNCNNDSYYFTIDDDIIYPKDYSEKLINVIKTNNNNVVCCVHGSDIDLNLKSNYYKNKITYNFKNKLEENKIVMIPGVGTSCFYCNKVKINLLDFEVSNMSDVYISSFLYNQKIPIISIKRNNMWLMPIPTKGKTIWGNNPYDEIDKLINKTFK